MLASTASILRRNAVSIAWGAGVLFTANDNVGSICRVEDCSIAESLPGDAAGLDLCVYRTTNPKSLHVGDLVTVRSPESGKTVVKRLVANEGDWVRRNGEVKNVDIRPSEVIRRGYCWLEGDDAGAPDDSRAYGPMPSALLRGRVVAVTRFQLKSPLLSLVWV